MSKSCLAALLAACALLLIEANVWAQSPLRLQPYRAIELPSDPQAGKPGVLTTVAISPDGRLLATGGDDHLVHLCDPITGRVFKTVRGHADWVRTVDFHPSGLRLATAGDDRRVMVWDLPECKLAFTMNEPTQAVAAVSYSPDGRLLAACGFEGNVYLFDAQTGEMVSHFDAPIADMRAVRFSPDSRMLVAAGRNGRIRCWQLEDGSVAFDSHAQPRRVRCLAFPIDGGILACGGESPKISLVDPRSGEELISLPGRPGRAMSMTFCGPQRLAIGSSDNTIRVWELASQKMEIELTGHKGTVSGMAYHAASDMLVSVSFDTTVTVWQLNPRANETMTRVPREPAAR